MRCRYRSALFLFFVFSCGVLRLFAPKRFAGEDARQRRKGRVPGLLHGRLPQKRGAYASVFRRLARQAPVRLEGTCVISHGVPVATMVPPSLPPPGPMSTM